MINLGHSSLSSGGRAGISPVSTSALQKGSGASDQGLGARGNNGFSLLGVGLVLYHRGGKATKEICGSRTNPDIQEGPAGNPAS